MKIKRVLVKEHGLTSTTLSWVHNGKLVEKYFLFDASAVFSQKMNLVFVEAYADMEVQLLNLDGDFVGKYEIVPLEGYSFRGLNKNTNSKTGVSLLYHPCDVKLGNCWNDTEQYEFVMGDNTLGKFLDIYR